MMMLVNETMPAIVWPKMPSASCRHHKDHDARRNAADEVNPGH